MRPLKRLDFREVYKMAAKQNEANKLRQLTLFLFFFSNKRKQQTNEKTTKLVRGHIVFLFASNPAHAHKHT